MYIEDVFIASTIMRLFQKGHKPIEWSSGIRGLAYIYVALDYIHGSVSRTSTPIPEGFRLSDGYLDFDNELDMIGNGCCEIIHAKLPPFKTEAERVAHVIHLNRLLLEWADDLETYAELNTSPSNVEEVLLTLPTQ